MSRAVLHHHDLALGVPLPDASCDGVLCDPPYHLKASASSAGGFMGKVWDGGDIAFRPEVRREGERPQQEPHAAP